MESPVAMCNKSSEFEDSYERIGKEISAEYVSGMERHDGTSRCVRAKYNRNWRLGREYLRREFGKYALRCHDFCQLAKILNMHRAEGEGGRR
jgi:hypothetical protein